MGSPFISLLPGALVFDAAGGRGFPIVPESQLCLSYCSLFIHSLIYFLLCFISRCFCLFWFCRRFHVPLSFREFPETCIFRGMCVEPPAITPRRDSQTLPEWTLFLKKAALKIPPPAAAACEYSRSTQSTVLVWSYTPAAVPIPSCAPSDVSLLWAAEQRPMTRCFFFLRLGRCFRSRVADASPTFRTYVALAC